jgi:AraC-like DNA-binding protein
MADNSTAPYRIGVYRPAPMLEPFVRYYGYRSACLTDAIAVHPLNARTAPTLIFEFSNADATLHIPASGDVPVGLPRAILHGTQTGHRGELHIRGTIDSFDIVFQPDGLDLLFALPASEFTDFSFDAEAIFGQTITLFQERLADCHSLEERISTANQFLIQHAQRARARDGISVSARQILLGAGEGRIPAMAERMGLGIRQFRRRFVQTVGVSPKLFARIARFEAALERMGRFPDVSWTEVAYQFGYFDQMHMVHEFAQFTGGTPTRALRHFETAFQRRMPERRNSPAPSSDGGRWIL